MAKTFIAVRTTEWFLPAVQAFMLCQVMLVLEGFLADIADERTLTYAYNTANHFSIIRRQ